MPFGCIQFGDLEALIGILTSMHHALNHGVARRWGCALSD